MLINKCKIVVNIKILYIFGFWNIYINSLFTKENKRHCSDHFNNIIMNYDKTCNQNSWFCLDLNMLVQLCYAELYIRNSSSNYLIFKLFVSMLLIASKIFCKVNLPHPLSLFSVPSCITFLNQNSIFICDCISRLGFWARFFTNLWFWESVRK